MGRDGNTNTLPPVCRMLLGDSVAITVLMGLFVWWGLALLPLFAYYILYWAEMLKLGHSAFNFEAEKECEEVCYFVMRKRFAWRKWYWKKELPPIKSIWDL